MHGPSHFYVPPEHRPTLVKMEMEFNYEPSKRISCDYSKLISELKLHGLVPDDIDSYNYEYMSGQPFAKRYSRYLSEELSVEGEPWVDAVAYPQVLLTLRKVTSLLAKDFEFSLVYKHLIIGRLAFFHNLILDKPVSTLASLVIESYLAYTSAYSKSKHVSTAHFVAIKLEFANALLFYYKYSEAERCIDVCKQILNVDIEYTGRLGRRTKYQQFDVAQLVVKLESYKDKPK
jgi:hypothetical protein